ncbi:MAG: hypothetical protein ACRCS9_02980 [Hyphomicrobium sp.]
MPNFNSVAAMGWTRPRHGTRIARLMLISALAASVAGCETGTNILAGGAGDPSAAPPTTIAQPTTPPPAAVQSARIEIAPVIGAPEAVASDIQNQLGNAIERKGISVARGPAAKGEYVLRGYIVAAREKSGSKVSYIWDVTDQGGKRAHRVTGEEFAAGSGPDPWSSVNIQIVQSIAEKTAAQIASWLPGGAGTPVASYSPTSPAAVTGTPASQVQTSALGTPANGKTAVPAAGAAGAAATTTAMAPAAATTGSIEATGPVSTVIAPVTGAPGDGSQSLTGAIQRELAKNGVALASVATAQTYKVEGKVAMGQGKDGKQPIQIDWHVVDPKGKKLGTVSQKNEVPQGSLDGTWGKTADAAAAAAAQGILKLLPQNKATN